MTTPALSIVRARVGLESQPKMTFGELMQDKPKGIVIRGLKFEYAGSIGQASRYHVEYHRESDNSMLVFSVARVNPEKCGVRFLFVDESDGEFKRKYLIGTKVHYFETTYDQDVHKLLDFMLPYRDTLEGMLK